MPDHSLDSTPVAWWRRPDTLAIALLIGLTFVILWQRWVYDNWLARHDLLTFFIPWFGSLGDRLASFDIPALNPYIFSGAPFAGDPESGWMYAPAMLLFPFFQVTVAYKLMILALLLLAGTSTYGFARLVGYNVAGALFAAIAFEFGPFLYGQTDCCTVGTMLGAFFPLAFIGVELAIRAKTWPSRIAAWSLGGFAISQMFAAWLGQGIVNALLIVGAWVVFRTLITPPDPTWGRWQRLTAMTWTGPGVVGMGILLGAAGILPRYAANGESNNPGGDYSTTPGASDSPYHTLDSVLRSLLTDNHGYRGTSIWGVVLITVLLAFFLMRRHSVLPYFGLVTALIPALAMGLPVVTDFFYLIPMYENIQVHSPGRILWLLPFIVAMLAGGAVAELHRLPALRWHWRGAAVVVPFALAMLAGWYITQHNAVPAGRWFWITTSLTMAVVAVLCLAPQIERWVPRERLVRGTLATLIALGFILPNGLDLVTTIRADDPLPGELAMWGNDPWMQGLIAESLATTDPDGAGAFLQRQRDAEQPFRFIAYGGMYHPQTVRRTYPDRRLEPAMVNILQNSRPMRLELETTQGYNPVQPMVYQEFMTILNRKDQNYHFANLVNTGVNSPLLDLLNVRYIVVDRTIPELRDDIVALAAVRTEVYRDANVIIFESPTVLPRAWMVYDVRLDASLAGLVKISTGEVSGATVAFIDDTVPVLAPPTSGTTPQVTTTDWEPDRLTFEVNQTGYGMLMVSQIWSENWKATVDGKEVRVIAADHALLGIPMEPGTHEVVLHYQPTTLTIGLVVSTLTGVGCLSVTGVVIRDSLAQRRGHEPHRVTRMQRFLRALRQAWHRLHRAPNPAREAH